MIPPLVYADRYRNEGTRIYSKHADYTEAQEKYRPNSRHPQFDLAVFEVPRDQMHIYTANPSIALATTYLRQLQRVQASGSGNKGRGVMSEPGMKYDGQYDVIVIGSGFAGLAAAIEAKLTGASVLILEKMKGHGGNSSISDGYPKFLIRDNSQIRNDYRLVEFAN